MWESYNTYDTIKSKLELITGQVEVLNKNKNYIINKLKKIKVKKETEMGKTETKTGGMGIVRSNTKERENQNLNDSSMSNVLKDIFSDKETIFENINSHKNETKESINSKLI